MNSGWNHFHTEPHPTTVTSNTAGPARGHGLKSGTKNYSFSLDFFIYLFIYFVFGVTPSECLSLMHSTKFGLVRFKILVLLIIHFKQSKYKPIVSKELNL